MFGSEIEGCASKNLEFSLFERRIYKSYSSSLWQAQSVQGEEEALVLLSIHLRPLGKAQKVYNLKKKSDEHYTPSISNSASH